MPSILARTRKINQLTQKKKRKPIPGRRSREAQEAMKAKYAEALGVVKRGKELLGHTSQESFVVYKIGKNKIPLEKLSKAFESIAGFDSLVNLHKRFVREQVLWRQETQEIMVNKVVTVLFAMCDFIRIKKKEQIQNPRNQQEILDLINDVANLKTPDAPFFCESLGLNKPEVLEYVIRVIRGNKNIVNNFIKTV